MKDPRDCVPVGTVPLMALSRIPSMYHYYNGPVVPEVGTFCKCDVKPKCVHIGFRVPVEMVSTFKY